MGNSLAGNDLARRDQSGILRDLPCHQRSRMLHVLHVLPTLEVPIPLAARTTCQHGDGWLVLSEGHTACIRGHVHSANLSCGLVLPGAGPG